MELMTSDFESGGVTNTYGIDMAQARARYSPDSRT